MAIFRKSGKYERYEAKKAPTFGGSNGAFLPFRFCGSPSSIRPVTPNRAVTAARNLARLEHVQARRLLRERFWERVWTEPGAVATYLSLLAKVGKNRKDFSKHELGFLDKGKFSSKE